jgi:glycosyltransferase involved in cell wall biosynthesis
MMETPQPKVSVIILTWNEEESLPLSLASLSGLSCETFVVDSGSTDNTVRIAEGAGASVVQHPFENYSLQRNWAQEHLPLRAEWLLHLDAGERLTPNLVHEINAAAENDSAGVCGYLVARRTIFLGRWIRHGAHYPVFHLRLFRRGMARCEDRLYDQHFITGGKTAKLKNDFIDVLPSNLSGWSMRHLRWAEMEAAEIAGKDGAAAVGKAAIFEDGRKWRRWMRQVVYRRCPLFFRPFGYWFYRYFLRLGFLDGKEGLIFHFLQGFWFRFLIDCNIYCILRRSHETP